MKSPTVADGCSRLGRALVPSIGSATEVRRLAVVRWYLLPLFVALFEAAAPRGEISTSQAHEVVMPRCSYEAGFAKEPV